MFRFVSRCVASLANPTRRPRTTPAPRRPRLGLETLEGRDVPSASPLQGLVLAANHSPALVAHANLNLGNLGGLSTHENLSASAHRLHFPLHHHKHQVPDLTGLTFHLTSSNGKPAHDLTIQSETFSWWTGNATFTGIWHGEKGGGDNPITNARLWRDADGSVKMHFEWNGAHYFDGTVTWVHSSRFFLNHWHLEGDVTVPGNPNGGPGHVSGNAYLFLLTHALQVHA